MKKMFVFALVALMALPVVANAQTFRVFGSIGGVPSVALDVPAAPFDIVVTMDPAGSQSSAAEFVITEILQTYPGVFKTGTLKINGTNLDLGNNSLGEYLLSFGVCWPAEPSVELVRITYFDFGAAIGNDFVIDLRGFQPGDTQGSSFNGQPGFVDCQSVKIAGVRGGADGGYTGTDVVFPDGACVLNPTPIVVDAETESFGQLKARF